MSGLPITAETVTATGTTPTTTEAGIGAAIDAGIGTAIDAGSGTGIDAGIGAGIDAGIGAGIDTAMAMAAETAIVAGAGAAIGTGGVAAVALLGAAAVFLLRLRRRMVVVEVSGRSMHPTYADGERVLVRRAALADIRPGEVVVFAVPPVGGAGDAPPSPRGRLDGQRWLIKRAAALPGQPVPESVRTAAGADTVPAGHLVVLGDNPDGSIDSRAWGLLPAPYLLGVVHRRMGR